MALPVHLDPKAYRDLLDRLLLRKEIGTLQPSMRRAIWLHTTTSFISVFGRIRMPSLTSIRKIGLFIPQSAFRVRKDLRERRDRKDLQDRRVSLVRRV